MLRYILVKAIDYKSVHIDAFGKFDTFKQVHSFAVQTDQAFFGSFQVWYVFFPGY